ncbi:MAG: hypothetical protein WCJ55_18945 [Chloroflexales bacterium]
MRAVLRRRAVWHAAGTQLARLTVLLLIIALAGVGLAAAAISIQAQRDETRSADLLLVIAPDLPPAALIEYSFDLYRRGYAVQVALAGPGRGRARADLLARGIPATALGILATGESLFDALAAAHSGGAQSLLVVSAPADQLLCLKVAHDQGMQAYGSLLPTPSMDLLDALRAALDYWRYALFQA